MKLSIIVTRHDWATPHLAAIDATPLHGLYIADHPSFATTDSWSWLAFAAARTKRIRLGTHVTGAPFHHPTRLAKQVAAVDVLSGGRAVLGLGTAYEHQDFEPYGFAMPDFAGRVRYLEDSIVVLRQLFAGRIDGFDGRHFQYRGAAEFAPAPVQARVPIWIGLNRRGTVLEVAARQADAINTWQLSPTQVAALRAPLQDALVQARRPADAVAITCDVVLARGANETGARVLAHRIRDMARSWGRQPSVTNWDAGGVLHGDSDAMAEQLAAFAAAGCSELTVAVNDMAEIDWLAEHLAPRAARLGTLSLN